MRRLLNKRNGAVALIVIVFSIVFFVPSPFASAVQDPDPALLQGKQRYLDETKPAETTQPRPNVIVIVADDLGKYDTGLYGGTDVPTPNISALAAGGVVFDQGYVTAAICSPSRAGLLTGRYQQRYGHELQPIDRYPASWFTYLFAKHVLLRGQWKMNDRRDFPNALALDHQGLPKSEITLAELAKAQGYQTGIIGKWHLGYDDGLKPLDRGFDYHYGFYEAFSLFAPKNAEGIREPPAQGHYRPPHLEPRAYRSFANPPQQ